MHTPDRPLRIGLIGCGASCQRNHVPALRQLQHAHITAVADPDARRAATVARQIGSPCVFPDGDALIAAGVADVVAVLAPPALHRRLAEQALDAGLHLLLEKPVGLSLDDADALVAAARRKDLCALMGFHMRWHRLMQRARRHLDQAGCGVVESMRGTWNSPLADDDLQDWKSHRGLGGGALFEIGANVFDLWRYLLRDEIAEVFAWSRSVTRDDESAGVLVKCASGAVATAHVSGGTAHNIELEISGSGGRLWVSGQRFDGLQWFARHETPGMVGPRIRHLRQSILELPAGLAGMRRRGDYGDSFRQMWSHLLQCIGEGTAVDCTMADGREALRCVLAAVESARTNTPVSIGPQVAT